MNTRTTPPTRRGRLARLGVLLAALACVLAVPASLRAQTAGGTAIQNRASASYSDGTTTYETISNQVTVTVANVSGLAITPDNGSVPSVVPGKTNVDFFFTVTNTSNFPTNVRFRDLGKSVIVSANATLQAAVIDDGDNVLEPTDADIKNNAADYLFGPVAKGGTFVVIVRVNVSASAVAGTDVTVQLGDTAGAGSGDNVAADNSAAEVSTSTPVGTIAPVNGESEARGNAKATVDNDTQLQASLVVPSGPVALGSNITYTMGVTNTGLRPASAQTLQGAPAGSNTGVFVVVPIPVGTTFSSVTLPGGVSVLYSTTTPLGADPGPGDPPATGPVSAAVTWTTAQPAPGTITRVAFRVGATLGAAGSGTESVSNIQMALTVQTTINASNPIYGIAEAFARNSLNAPLTDQSDIPGSQVSNKGDGNANFNEPRSGVDPVSATRGFQLPTTLVAVGSVLIGPAGQPGATGPTSTDDDYTNKTVPAAVFAGIEPGATVGAVTLDFVNTVQNTGNANDTFTLSAPTVPAGFTVQVSTDGSTFTTVSGGGSTTLAVPFAGSANITVRVSALAGKLVLTGFSTTIRAQSANTPGSTNHTIDRLYTGFLRLQKSVAVFDPTGAVPGPPVPGAVIEYTISYDNVSSSGDPANPTAGTGSVLLTASNITITEDGTPGPGNPNNWATFTTQVVGSAIASRGSITGDAAGSTLLTNVILSLPQGEAGTFKFRRKIN